MINKRIDLPTCGAAMPTPNAVCIVSNILVIRSCNSGYSLVISVPTLRKTGSPYAIIGNIIFNYLLIQANLVNT